MTTRVAFTTLLMAASCSLTTLPMMAAATAVGQAPARAPDSATANVSDAAPVLVSSSDWQRMAEQGKQSPLFAEEQARVTEALRDAMKAGINVPLPKDPGGGFTHEQHKRNYKAIEAAGTLYRLTGDRAYADFARDMLLEYAKLYPTLGRHPAGRGDKSGAGKLFWQTLNDSVWLVYAIQGYDAIRDTLNADDRRTIDEQVFRRMARFLSEETPKIFDQIHNHATWATASVGMTGYVLRDRKLVDVALRGLKRDGTFGFVRQVDLLFSPDGYYEEGPYYQRYALEPFMRFAQVISRNDPAERIFQRRDGVLLKAVDALVQSSYGGYFFPLNDAMPDKGLDTGELVAGIAITYAQTGDDRLLGIARQQGRTTLSPEGLAVSDALQAGKTKPFGFRPTLLRDGPDGTQGALAILRMNGENGQALVMKNTMQGMGHGHFDKLNWLFYDNGNAVVGDYGAARFLNIEAKSGGVYLPENDSWAQQTIAHNTLVVNGRSQFDNNWKVAEKHWPTPLLFDIGNNTQVASARMQDAYEGVTFTRTMALASHPALPQPVVIDLLRVQGKTPAQLDLPLHFNGHVMTVGFEAQRYPNERPVLGTGNGYQHLWVDAMSAPGTDTRTLAWLLDGRFYTYRFAASAPSRAILAESGANDPDFNLRREPALIQRIEGARDATFFSVLEPHGRYDGTAETVQGSSSRITAINHVRGADADVVVLSLVGGQRLVLGIADDTAPTRKHQVVVEGRTLRWTGGYARLDDAADQASPGRTSLEHHKAPIRRDRLQEAAP